MKRNWIRNVIGGLGFGSVLFVFQACYGTPQDFGADFLLEGQVKSKTTGEPIQGIKVSVPKMHQEQYTNDEGRFAFYVLWADSVAVAIEDVDSTLNGKYFNQDTILCQINDRVFLDIAMVEK